MEFSPIRQATLVVSLLLLFTSLGQAEDTIVPLGGGSTYACLVGVSGNKLTTATGSKILDFSTEESKLNSQLRLIKAQIKVLVAQTKVKPHSKGALKIYNKRKKLLVSLRTRLSTISDLTKSVIECQKNQLPSVCGNGIIDLGEICDGNCPTGCSQLGCKIRVMTGDPANCTSACVTVANQIACTNSDGCCPAGCNASNDTDCPAVCGNGILEAGELCDGNCPTCSETHSCFTSTGSAQTCDLVCHSPVQACSGVSDSCCPLIAGGQECGSATDSNCAGSQWRFARFADVSLTQGSGCRTISLYFPSMGGSYMFTSCVPPGVTAGTADPIIQSIKDNLGNSYNESNDDCTDPSALPYLAGWNCDVGGFQRAFCSSNNPGGFILNAAVTRLDVVVCPFGPSTGIVPFYIWYNAPSIPNPG